MTTISRHDIPTLTGAPLLGHFAAFRARRLALFETLSHAGDVVWFWVGPYRILFLNDPSLIREALSQHGSRLERMGRTNTYLRPFLGEGLLTSSGETHRSERRAIGPHLSPVSIGRLGASIVSLTEQRVRGWEHGATIDLAQELTTLTLEVIGAALFGTTLSAAWGTLCAAFTHLEEYVTGGVNALLPLPPEWPLPANQRMRRVAAEFDRALTELLSAARQLPPDSGALAPILQQQLPPQLLRDELATLLFAGHETTASALTWTLALLDQHPAIAHELRLEVDQVLRRRAVTVADLPSLPFLDRVLKESIRLYPPVYVIVGGNGFSQGIIGAL